MIVQGSRIMRCRERLGPSDRIRLDNDGSAVDIESNKMDGRVDSWNSRGL